MWDTMVRQVSFPKVYGARMIGRDISVRSEDEPHHLRTAQLELLRQHLAAIQQNFLCIEGPPTPESSFFIALSDASSTIYYITFDQTKSQLMG